MTLKFRSSALIQELEFVKRASEKYLTNSWVLDDLEAASKRGLKGQVGSTFRWEIPQDKPLRTKTSYGDYARDGEGGLNVFATLSFIWNMRVVSGGANAVVEPFDLTSTEIKLFKELPGDACSLLAHWNFDVADLASPGCHFHLQVHWPIGSEVSLDVPRVPVPMVLPTDALEFILGELFQTDWPKHRTSHGVNTHQRSRMARMLEWMHEQLSESGAPWLALKALKPQAASKLFLPG